MTSEQAKEILKEAARRRYGIRRRRKKNIFGKIKSVGAKLYTSPTFWTATGALTGVGSVLLGTKVKNGKVVTRIPSRKMMAVMAGLWGGGSAAGEAVLDRVMFGKAYRERKKSKKLWGLEKRF